jgi:hypothetical protein
MEEIEFSNEIKGKLSELIMFWADEHLIGKPEILATNVYVSLLSKLMEKTKEINGVFS